VREVFHTGWGKAVGKPVDKSMPALHGKGLPGVAQNLLQLRVQLGLAPEQWRLVAIEGLAWFAFVLGPALAQVFCGLRARQRSCI